MESLENENNTWNHENKGMKFKTPNMKGRNLEPLQQVHETQKVENNVMEH